MRLSFQQGGVGGVGGYGSVLRPAVLYQEDVFAEGSVIVSGAVVYPRVFVFQHHQMHSGGKVSDGRKAAGISMGGLHRDASPYSIN